MSCGKGGKNRYFYTGNQVGDLNQVGDFNFVSGGPAGTGLVAGTTVPLFFANTLNRRIFEQANAVFNDALLDATFPYINMRWFAEITLDTDVLFRVSDRSFYVNDADGTSRYYDARVDKAPTINVTTGDWLAQNYQVSNVTLELNNRDGAFNKYLPQGAQYRQWSGAKVVIKLGFSENFDNYMTVFTGQVTVKQGMTTTRDTIQIQAYDQLDPNTASVPPNVYGTDLYPDIASGDAGNAVPLVYGDWTDGVPSYGAIPATCINALEDSPDTFVFKVSDIELESLDSVWLHRGNDSSGNPVAAIEIQSNCLIPDITEGQFSVLTNVPVLNQPTTLIDGGKCGPSSGTGFITSDGSIDFLSAGVKVGDRISDNTDQTATVTSENLQFLARRTGATPRTGASGNGISVTYNFSATSSDPKSSLALTVSVTGDAITVSIPSKIVVVHGSPTTVTGSTTASSIASAIRGDDTANNLVQCVLTGTVPGGYPDGTTIGDVRQTVPGGPHTLGGGVDAGGDGVITSVTNFQFHVTGSTTFNEGDSYTVVTVQYTYVDGDKFSVICKGKPLNQISVTRMSDVASGITTPMGVAILPDSTYWISDDATQMLYHVDFTNKILAQVAYSAIAGSLTSVSGVSLGVDAKLWISDPNNNILYRLGTDGSELTAIPLTSVTGISSFGSLSSVAAKSDGKLWVVDQTSSEFYQIDPFSSTAPFVVSQFNASAYDTESTSVTDIDYDEATLELVVADRNTNTCYRIDPSDGTFLSSFSFTDVDPGITFVSGISVADDGSIFILDNVQAVLYNWNEADDASTNPCFIARDLLQKFNGRTYADFDLSWNQTATQLNGYRARAYVNTSTALVTYINNLLTQFNVQFYARFQKFALFWITFANFRTNGKLVTEKDIGQDQFVPAKETDQYFNSMTVTYAQDYFADDNVTSDTYISPAGVSFAGDEYNRTFDMPNIYRRTEIDRIVPLLVKLSVPEPEFIDVQFGFRVIRNQIHDFFNLDYTQDLNRETFQLESGKRFPNVPCMIRGINYDLSTMTMNMHLWSLGTTTFDGYTPPGRTVGGEGDKIVLTNVGRLARFSPALTVTAIGSNYLDLGSLDGHNAEHITTIDAGAAFVAGYTYALIDAAAQTTFQTLTVASVSGARVTFVEDIATGASVTTLDGAGFPASGLYLEMAAYTQSTEAQRAIFGSYGRPTTAYPTSTTQELEEQRGGVHSFPDGGLPYVLYPVAFEFA